MLSKKANFWTNSSKPRLVLVGLLCVIIAGSGLTVLRACRQTDTSATLHRWDLVAEGENRELYFIDRKAITRVSDDIVKVTVKYVPSKDQFLISLQEISKQFGGKGKEADYEYTVSTWEFDCKKGDGRCLNLAHYRKGLKIASYEYPDQKWSSLDKTTSTKLLRNLVCGQTTAAESKN